MQGASPLANFWRRWNTIMRLCEHLHVVYRGIEMYPLYSGKARSPCLPHVPEPHVTHDQDLLRHTRLVYGWHPLMSSVVIKKLSVCRGDDACSTLYIGLIYLYLSQFHGVTHRRNLILEPFRHRCATTLVVKLTPRNEPD